MTTLIHIEDAHAAVNRLAEKARFWEQKARDAEEGYNTLLQDHAILKAEFDDVAANAQALTEAGDQLVIDIEEWMQSNHHCSGSAYRIGQWRKALDARPGESVARLKAEVLEEMAQRLRDDPAGHPLFKVEYWVNKYRLQATGGE